MLVTLCFGRYTFLAITLRQDPAAALDRREAAWAPADLRKEGASFDQPIALGIMAGRSSTSPTPCLPA